MPRYNHKKCEDDDDARRMAETILRELGHQEVRSGTNVYDVKEELPVTALENIARNAERVARWAREELKSRR